MNTSKIKNENVESTIMMEDIFDFIDIIENKFSKIDVMYICEGGYRGWAKDSKSDSWNIELYCIYKFKNIIDYTLVGNRKVYNFKNSKGNILCKMYEVTELIRMLTEGDIKAWEILQSKIIWKYNKSFDIVKDSCKLLFDSYRIMVNIQEELRKLIFIKDLSGVNIISRIFDITKYYAMGYHICEYNSIFPMDITILCNNLMKKHEYGNYVEKYLSGIGNIDKLGQITTQTSADGIIKNATKFYNSLSNRISVLKENRNMNIVKTANLIIINIFQ